MSREGRIVNLEAGAWHLYMPRAGVQSLSFSEDGLLTAGRYRRPARDKAVLLTECELLDVRRVVGQEGHGGGGGGTCG